MHMHARLLKCRVFGAVVIAAVLAVRVMAGPLSPPAGPVGASYKTLSEVEPRIAVNETNTPGAGTTAVYKITAPGSYYLTGNVTAVGSKNAIGIYANNVTLDLNGFTVEGLAGSTSAVILVAGDSTNPSVDPRGNVTIKNGTVRGGGGAGVLSQSTVSGVRLSGVTARNNTGTGFGIGDRSQLENCSASDNGSHGFLLGSDVVVIACIARTNGGDEFRAGAGSVFSNCLADNGGANGAGFNVGAGAAFSNCTAINSQLDSGFECDGGGAFENCTARGNGGSGFRGDGDGNVFTGCTSSENGAHGFSFTNSTTIANCNAFSNGQHGALVTSGSTITGSTFRGNGIDGIRASNACVILNNSCYNNTGAGILVTGSGNTRVEGNTVTNNATGISVAGGAIVVRNTASNNPAATGANDFVSSGNNAIGQIFDVTAGATITTSNSFANFKY
ncbi:MAG TPA: right-handed parallel beta-helix repeat-containing protein [Phycisphaerales bacterium]